MQYLTLGLLATAIAASTSRRQLNGVLQGLAGNAGVDATFDYVVVGGGTAGLAVASRLAEDADVTVAVVEAGSIYQVTSPIFAETPAADVYFCGSDRSDTNPAVDWDFITEPQAGGNGRQTHYARGKCLGGSSARNFMIYQRGTVGSYQTWADAVGDKSWTWENTLPYFKKSIEFTPPGPKRAQNASAEYLASAFDPEGGPLEVSYANYAQTFSGFMEGALNEIGVPTREDFNSGELFGAQYCSSTISPKDAKRSSSETSFLKAAANAPNLKVYSETIGEKVIFVDQKRATGVRVSTAKVPYTLHASREVILSAGAFQSPQILMLSGVGPRDQLSKFDIPIVADRPGVGQNLTDHIFFGPSYRVSLETFTRVANDPIYLAARLVEFETMQSGPLTNPVADFLAWEKVPQELRSTFSQDVQQELSKFPADWPEVEYITAPGHVGNFGALYRDQPKDGYQYATILGTLVAPLSRGQVTLASTDPYDKPLIDPNWLTHPADQAVAVAAYKRVRAAFASRYMSRILADPVEYWPGVEVETDAQILATIADSLQTVWHASCSCRMGLANDTTAVVDSRARVIGVERLRVVDASSFAILPPGHPQSTIYMLAEKIAQDIKDSRME